MNGNRIRIVFIGALIGGHKSLKALLEAGENVTAAFTWSSSRSDASCFQSFDDIVTAIASQDAGTAFNVTVERPADGGDPERLTFEGVRSRRRAGDPAPGLGIEPAREPVIYAMIPGVPEEQAGLKVGDRILTVNGKPVSRYREIGEILSDAPPGPVTLAVERDAQRIELTIDPAQLTLGDQTDTAALARLEDALARARLAEVDHIFRS